MRLGKQHLERNRVLYPHMIEARRDGEIELVLSNQQRSTHQFVVEDHNNVPFI